MYLSVQNYSDHPFFPSDHALIVTHIATGGRTNYIQAATLPSSQTLGMSNTV